MMKSAVWESELLWMIVLALSCIANLSLAADDEILLTFKSGVTDEAGLLSSWNSSSPLCTWYGVSCDNNRRVTALRLDSAHGQLAGTISGALGGLSKLENLTLSNNRFSGVVPFELGNCSNLQNMLLGSNFFTGTVPATFGNLTVLQVLDLSSNSLKGSIPSELGKCVQLKRLIVNDNLLTGSVPPALGNINSLQYLRLSNNNFSSEIPLALGNCSKLQELDMSNNRLTGKFPDTLERCPSLATLNLTLNSLSGPIPPSIGNFSSQVPSGLRLHLGHNLFSGPFPEELFKLKSLGELVLAGNKLNGSLPDKFGQFQSDQLHIGLSNLDLSFNMFTGDIPSSISLANALLELSLSNNRFQGFNFFSSPHLLVLDLSNNSLSGSLADLNFPSIQTINLRGNNLIGSIPAGLHVCWNLRYLDLSNNDFTNDIPSLGDIKGLVTLRLANNNLNGSVDVFPYSKFTTEAFLPGNPGLCGSSVNRRCPVRSPAPSPEPQGLPGSSSGNTGIEFLHKWRKETVLASAVAVFGLCVVLASWLDIVRARIRYRRNSVAYYLRGLKVIRLGVDDLVKATGRFSASNVVGSGGTSTVYRGLLQSYPFVIAVKKFDDTKDGRRRLLKEAGIMKNIRHRHLVGTLGIASIPKSINVLVLEYMMNGTLDHHLHTGEVCELSWNVRLGIVKDVATAISYLHEDTGAGYTVIHGDLKPANIFLDSNFLAKIGDFGLTRILADGSKELVHTERSWEGTFGYAPPEHGEGLISTAGDVYSFGVVVLEMVTRRRPTDPLFTETGESFISWVRDYFPENVCEIVDPSLAEELTSIEVSVELLLRIGLLCTRDNPRERPNMREAIEMINTIAKPNSSSAMSEPLPTLEQLSAEPSFTSFQHAKNWGWINNDFLFDIRDSCDNSWFSLFKIDMRDSRVLGAMGFGSEAIKSIRNQFNKHDRAEGDGSSRMRSCLGVFFGRNWRRISKVK